MVKKITIIGIGNGALTAAADLTLRGFDVTLYANKRYEKRLKPIMDSQKITLTGVGVNGEARLHKITTDLNDALSDVDLIMPVIPAYGFERFVDEIYEYLKPGHKIVLTPGSTGGALIISKMLHEKNALEGITIAEMHTLPYACRITSPTSANILLECQKLYFAAFPAKNNEEMYKLVKQCYPAVELVQDVLETALNNGNPVSHPAPVVLNAGKIEYSKGEHYHYREGITPSVARVVEKIDKERQNICEKFGYKVIDAKDRLAMMGYAPKRETLYECYRDSQAFSPLKGPDNLSNRYLTEDTPCSLVALANLAKVVGIKTTVMNSVINLASALMDEDYMESGVDVDDLGFTDMNLHEIKQFLQTGYCTTINACSISCIPLKFAAEQNQN